MLCVFVWNVELLIIRDQGLQNYIQFSSKLLIAFRNNAACEIHTKHTISMVMHYGCFGAVLLLMVQGLIWRLMTL